MSLFDMPKKSLSQAVFNRKEKMLPETRHFIIYNIAKLLPPNSVRGIYLLGSMARRNYSEDSDLDIYIHLKPPYTREQLDEYMDSHKGTLLPGTNHPINYFVDDPEKVDFTTSKYAVYDILNDKWVKEPKSYEEMVKHRQQMKSRFNYADLYAITWQTLTPKQQQALMRLLEIRKNWVYSTGWGAPHDSLQNVLFKYMEDIKPEYAPHG